MAIAGNENTNDYLDITIFTIKDTKLYIPVVTLSEKGNQKLPKLLSDEFERSIYWNEYKTKSGNKNTTNEYKYFLESKFVKVKRLFALVYSTQHADSKRFKTRRYYLSKGIIDNYIVIINRKSFYDQPIDSDIKQHEEFTKLTTEDDTTGCLLDYDCVKIHYRLIPVDLSKEIE